ncbi:MAG: hypothetical protein AAF636_19580 [Pseudomonadota bacterium]
MDSNFQMLLRLHKVAQQFGDGLKPELARLLTPAWDAYGHRVVPLDPNVVSSGPVHQAASAEDLDSAGIPQLDNYRDKQSAKDGTDG